MTTIDDALIKRMRADAAKQRRTLVATDDVVKGLRLRVSYGGSATFSLIYRPRGERKMQRIQVGKYPEIKISEARRIATGYKGEVAAGGDPLQRIKDEREARRQKAAELDKQAKALAGRLTVRQLAERFLFEKRKLRWYGRYEQMLNYNLLEPKLAEMKLGIADKALEDFTDKDIDKILAAISARGSEIQARRFYETLRAMVRWGIKKKLLKHDPIAGVSVPDNSKARERFLSVAELCEVWNTLTEWDEQGARGEEIPIPLGVVRVLRLQILLAQRSGEITGMRKHELSDDGYEWEMPGERTKNAERHSVPLPPLAREIIAAAVKASPHKAYVFPVRARDGSGLTTLRADVVSTHVGSIQEHFNFTDKEGKQAPWTAHDLRRTVATYLRKNSVGKDVVAAILNHKSERKSDVTGKHYDHSEQEYAKREALSAWQGLLEEIAEGVDPFARSKEDIAELEARLIKKARGPKLVALEGGRA